jgi:hypothetical protein
MFLIVIGNEFLFFLKLAFMKIKATNINFNFIRTASISYDGVSDVVMNHQNPL